MKEYLLRIKSNTFFKNVAVLASGTIVSQIVVVVGSLLLARIYDSSDFGTLSLFTSLATIFAVFTTGRYEYAVMLPKEQKDAKAILYLIGIIASVVCSLYMILILVLRNFQLGKYSELFHSSIIYALPIYIFFAAIYSALQYWNQRNKVYKMISFVNIIQGVSNVTICIILGLVSVLYGLIYGLILAILVSIIYIVLKNKYILDAPEKSSIKEMAKKYISFPKYMMVSDFSVAFSQQMVPIIFSSIFSSSMVGFYAMANRLLRLPTIVITTSISDVFRNECLDRIKLQGNCTSLYKKTFNKLLLIGIPLFLSIYFISPYLIKVVLGSKWEKSGEFAQVLCLLLFFEFISIPLNSLFYIYEKQKIYMFIQFFNSIFGVAVIYLGYHFFHNALHTLIFFSMNSVIFNLICLWTTFNLSKK